MYINLLKIHLSIFEYLYKRSINETKTIDNYNILIFNLSTVTSFPKSK